MGQVRHPHATITVWPTHFATAEPVVPEVRQRLLRRVVRFGGGGPLGHTARPALSDAYAVLVRQWRIDEATATVVPTEAQLVPLGLVPLVAGWLRALGYAVTVVDRRTDSRRWCPVGYAARPAAPRAFLAAVAAYRALRVVARGLRRARPDLRAPTPPAGID